MTGIKMKLIALFLAAALFVPSFSELRLYAAEAEEPLETVEDYSSEAVSETETWTETEYETISEIKTEYKTESETQAETENKTEPESETEHTTEYETENMTETTTELETVMETETETETEDELETATESIPPCPAELEPENVPYDENQDTFTENLVNGRKTRSALPAKYDAREKGYLPAVRNQGSWGACWSFSITGVMEISAIRDMDAAADKIDLSEQHLAYFGYNTGHDALGNANEDTMSSPDDYYLKNGGNEIV